MCFSTLPMLSGLLVCLMIAIVAAQTKPGCRSTCGDLNIPYPFGTSEGCYKDENFKINCFDSSAGTLMANYSSTNIQVLNISLNGELRLSAWVASLCFDRSGRHISGNDVSFGLNRFTISSSNNKFIVVGCDTYAFINDYWGKRFSTGCTTRCLSVSDVSNGSCSGIGCCESAFAEGNLGYNITLKSYYNNTNISQFSSCSYAFVAEKGAFRFSSLDLKDLRKRRDFPLVVNWAIANESCAAAMKNTTSYSCKENSICVDSENGYRCRCEEGFQGNPYLSNGCQDIDECITMSPCNMTCHNFDGGYNCSCPSGYKGDGKKDGSGCFQEVKSNKELIIEIALGISIGMLVLFILTFSLCWVHKQRRVKQFREKCFMQNGGPLLQERLSELQRQCERTRIFTEVELMKATNNFHESRILGRGGQGIVYKGILPNNQVVAIKRSRIVEDQRQVKEFINEVVVLSQINNRNVVKLLGCCLETEAPLLVYEFVSNGNLLDRIDPTKNAPSLPWETRLSIAAEIAEAVSYLHSTAFVPIIHRDIKSSNILLDKNDKAKVSDFGASKLVPLDQTQVFTLVQGTPGYLDPEYLQTGKLNEKSDVYSFGVVLIELFTGKKAIQLFCPEQDNTLVVHFVSSMEEGNLMELLDRRVLNQSNVEQIMEVASLARKCVRLFGEERPTMNEVAMELKGLIAMQKQQTVKGEVKSEENRYLLGHLANGTGNSSSYDSTQNQITFQIEDGR